MLTQELQGHAPRERVSWNLHYYRHVLTPLVTLHVSVWVEISKFYYFHFFIPCHAPRERVSWNVKQQFPFSPIAVTLHVSVWVEIRRTADWNNQRESRSTWACELKWSVIDLISDIWMSRSTWACELKLLTSSVNVIFTRSRSTWACELKYDLTKCYTFY